MNQRTIVGVTEPQLASTMEGSIIDFESLSKSEFLQVTMEWLVRTIDLVPTCLSLTLPPWTCLDFLSPDLLFESIGCDPLRCLQSLPPPV